MLAAVAARGKEMPSYLLADHTALLITAKFAAGGFHSASHHQPTSPTANFAAATARKTNSPGARVDIFADFPAGGSLAQLSAASLVRTS